MSVIRNSGVSTVEGDYILNNITMEIQSGHSELSVISQVSVKRDSTVLTSLCVYMYPSQCLLVCYLNYIS